MPQQPDVSVRFYAPPPDLCRYFTTFYVTDVALSAGETLTDTLQPEWANLRFFRGQLPVSWLEGGSRVTGSSFVATGPSCRCVNFIIGSGRIWGIGLLPLGWARFIHQPAAQHANLIADGHTHPCFAPFAGLADTIFADDGDETEELNRIVRFFRELPPRLRLDEPRIEAIHAALVDPDVASVRELVERVALPQRMIERVCDDVFGFSPKVLLRRQRFMRSLTQFMLDPSLKWIGAMDGQYHDQAQFVRDFRNFTDMSPREYAARPHPVLDKFMHERARLQGAAAQTLDQPRRAISANR
ncbi:MAG: hypothetical protein RIQ99_1313 [Pseudomonadota bacterium]|jgi:AraC-like DNA-binding protein